MTEKLKTCRDCHNLMAHEFPGGMKIYGCEPTGLTIPHGSSSEEKQATFWRVPMDCPRPDDEVMRQEEKRPHRDWQTLSWADA
ncbi:MAG: hypothetical protein CME61_08720 [Halobacteriovoraceae bacterium]|nr:hypothetical protein [Halobacteriovoraceae bacterium]OUX68076.1 MAG: hypothetical protein CBD38_00470 [bacterium TMED178]